MSAMSQHLARLRTDGLVSTRRESQTIFYSLASVGATRMLETLYTIYCSPADASPAQCETPPTPARARAPSHAVACGAGCVLVLLAFV